MGGQHRPKSRIAYNLPSFLFLSFSIPMFFLFCVWPIDVGCRNSRSWQGNYRAWPTQSWAHCTIGCSFAGYSYWLVRCSCNCGRCSSNWLCCGEPCFHLPCHWCVLFGLGFEGNPFAWSVISFLFLGGGFCSCLVLEWP